MSDLVTRLARELPEGASKRHAVRVMFDRIAPRYDFLNRALTLGLDRSWRRRTLDAIGVARGDVLLDVACGTGDLAELGAARGARVIGIDFAREMLRGAVQRRISVALAQSDAARLPLRDASIDAVTCGFALRNFDPLSVVLREMARVLRPGGRVGLIDVDAPRRAWLRAGHRLWFEHAVPRIGGWLSDRDAYSYLPRSVAYLPDRDSLLRMLREAGFRDARVRSLGLGAVQLLTASRAGAEA